MEYLDCERTCLYNLDCNDDCHGTAKIDNCENCTGGLTGIPPCEKDCNGVWGGNAYEDACGSCDSNSANDCEQDCNGVWGGDGKIDNCDYCDNDPNKQTGGQFGCGKADTDNDVSYTHLTMPTTPYE